MHDTPSTAANGTAAGAAAVLDGQATSLLDRKARRLRLPKARTPRQKSLTGDAGEILPGASVYIRRRVAILEPAPTTRLRIVGSPATSD